MKNVPLNDLSRLSQDDVRELTRRAESVISSGHFLFGPHTKEFVAHVAGRTSGAEVICVGNGTDALYLALAALGVGRGSRVATVSNAGGYASGAALRLGAMPVIVDNDPATAQMSPESLDQVLGKYGADVVVITHLYGLASRIEELVAVCARHGAKVLEDCAQSFGCVVEGKPVGTFGDIATFSFYPTKNLGALGDAGAVVTKNPGIAARAQRLAQYGWGERYVVSDPGGFNSRIDEIQAAFLNHRIASLDIENTRRREIVIRYEAACTSGRRMIHSAGPEFIGHLAVMLTDSRSSDQEVFAALGVSTGIHYPVLDHHQPAWKGLIDVDSVPSAENLVGRILTLPCFPSMTDEEVDQVVCALSALG